MGSSVLKTSQETDGDQQKKNRLSKAAIAAQTPAVSVELYGFLTKSVMKNILRKAVHTK